MLIKLIIIQTLIKHLLTSKFICSNGKDPKTLSKKQYLIEFSKGKCSPLLILPGLESTKLVVEINCIELKTRNKKLFQTCGWNHCEKRFWEFWKHVPKKEYNLWFPDFSSPLSIITLTEQENLCFANFIKQYLDPSKPIHQNPIPPIGYRIKVFGNTPDTKSKWKCGDGAITNLLNFPFNIQTKLTKTFSQLITSIQELGYKAGLTYQSLPYNFFRSYRNNITNIHFKSNIKRLNELTQKRVIVLAHSLGNIHTYYEVMKMKDEERKMIKSWVSIAAPFLGSLKLNNVLIAGDDALLFIKSTGEGLKVLPSLILAQNLGSFELKAQNPFLLYKDSKWFQAISNRTKYENNELEYEQSGFMFMPKKEDQCGPDQYKFKDCNLGLYDLTSNYTFKVQNSTYQVEEIDRIVEDWSLVENASLFNKMSEDKEFLKFDNPEIDMIAINLRSRATKKQFIYNQNVTETELKNKFPEGNYTYGRGDGTVPSFSYLIPLLKWAKEFELGIKNTKPVKFVDLCSTFNEKYSPYDQTRGDQEYKILSNEFFGISCDCIKDKNPQECNHPVIIADSYVLKLLGNILQTNERSYSADYEKYVQGLDSNYLYIVTEICPQVLFQQLKLIL